MGYEVKRKIHINKKDRYDSDFTQIDTAILGIVSQTLTHNGLRLYLFLISNKNGFEFDLSPLAYARWLGRNYKDGDKVDNTVRTNVNKDIRRGIEDLIEKGYLIEVKKDTFEFYEGGSHVETSNPEWIQTTDQGYVF